MSEELTRLQDSLSQEEKTSKIRSISLAPRKLQELQEEPVEPAEPSAEPLPNQMERSHTELVDGKEDEKNLVTVEIFKERIQTILTWYQLDDNETPLIYRLQPPR